MDNGFAHIAQTKFSSSILLYVQNISDTGANSEQIFQKIDRLA